MESNSRKDYYSLPYGMQMAEAIASAQQAKPTAGQIEEYINLLMEEHGKGQKPYCMCPEGQVSGLVETVITRCSIDVDALAKEVGVSVQSLRSWKRDARSITLDSLRRICKAVVTLSDTAGAAWLGLLLLTLAQVESTPSTIPRAERGMREAIKEAAEKLEGMPLYALYMYAAAMAEGTPKGWRTNINEKGDVSATQEAVIAAETWQAVRAYEWLRYINAPNSK